MPVFFVLLDYFLPYEPVEVSRHSERSALPPRALERMSGTNEQLLRGTDEGGKITLGWG